MSTYQEMKLNNFFKYLSDELWTIQKHPFSRVGQLNKKVTRQLSYDPSRVFKKSQQIQQSNQDEDYLEFQKEQFENELLVANDKLKKEVQQRYHQQIVKVSQLNFAKQKPLNLFNYDRGKCTKCDYCTTYQGNFNLVLNIHNQADLFECVKCLCPMNSHVIIVRQKIFSKLLYNNLLEKDLKQQNLNFNHFVGIFLVKKLKEENLNYNKVNSLLNQGGYSIEARQKIEIHDLINKLVERKLYSKNNKKIDKFYFDQYLNFLKFINDQDSEIQINQFDFPNDYEDKKDIPTFQKQFLFLIKIKQQIIAKLYDILGIKDRINNQNIFKEYYGLVFLLKGVNSQSNSNFQKFLKCIQQYMQQLTPMSKSKNQYKSIIDTQIFFPNIYKINYETLIIPNQFNEQSLKISHKFKDILDYNNYIILKQNFINLKRSLLEESFRFYKNAFMLNYILGQNIVMEYIPFLNLKILAKIGPSYLNILNQNVPNYIMIKQIKNNEHIYRNLFPELLHSQRCVIIMRPQLIKSGMDELVINYFRINNFTIIHRTFIKMEYQEALYMASIQNISKDQEKQYIQLMTNGIVQLILVAKRAAIYQANILSEGCKFGIREINTRILKQNPSLQINIGQKTYKQQLRTRYHNSFSNNMRIFNGVINLFDLQTIIFGNTSKIRNQSLIIDTVTGEIVKKQQYNYQNKKISPKISQAIMNQLNSQIFNYWIYTSTSETITEAIVNMFMPECSTYESICVIIKPGMAHLSKQIKTYIELLKYKIILSKAVMLSKSLATNIINSLQIVRLRNDTKNSLINKYSTNKIEILCLSKVSGRKQMLSFLKNFNFFDPRNLISLQQELNDQKLKQCIIPVWNNQSQVLQILSNTLYSVEKSINQIDVLSNQSKYQLLNYLIGSILGMTIQSISPIKTSIGDLTYLVLTNIQQAKIQSWYYSIINKKWPNYVPMIYQYRQYSQDTIFCLQNNNGDQFLKLILQEYAKQKNSLHNKREKQRNSLVLYLWAKKLAHFVKVLSQQKPPLKGFGKITKIRQQYRGIILNQNIIEQQKKRVNKYIKQTERNKQISKTLTKIMQMRAFTDRTKSDNRRLIPILKQQSLRVIKTSQITKLYMLDLFQMIDPEHELSVQNNLYTLCLFNVEVQIQSKYHLFASIYIQLYKYSILSKEHSQAIGKLLKLFIQLSEKNNTLDLQMLSIEIYLQMTELFIKGQIWLQNILNNGIINLYASYGKLNESNQDSSGKKKRKFIQKKQYYTGKSDLAANSKVQNQNQYIYNLYEDVVKPEKNPLFDPNDRIHSQWARQEKFVNLLREPDSYQQPRKGVNVEFQKRISQNQQIIKQKVNKQVDKYMKHGQQELLYQTGIQKNVWYRKVRKQQNQKAKDQKTLTKTELAIQKQAEKFLQFKANNNQNRLN